jgi:phosphoribosyl-AMP cyclohydrolase / phosphoribosyl-ATP pyrophosphohydrolase
VLTFDLDRLDFARGGGMVTVVAQDSDTGAVLMVAHADREAMERTLATGEMHYRSRTRGLWHKGATSGNVQRVMSLALDCDGDAVLARVRPAGPACHTGAPTCFGDPSGDRAFDATDTLRVLDVLIATRAAERESASSGIDPAEGRSYTRRLLDDRNLRLKKLGEESVELAVACGDGDRPRAIEEAADLLYHMMVALRSLGAGLDDVGRALEARRT